MLAEFEITVVRMLDFPVFNLFYNGVPYEKIENRNEAS